MNEIFSLTGLLLFIGLFGVVFSATMLIHSAVKIAHALSVPEYIIGFMLVSMGTSAPELVVSVVSSLKGSGEMAVANVFGSNIVNIGFGLSLALLIAGRKIAIHRGLLWVELPSILVMHIVFWYVSADLANTRPEGAALIIIVLLALISLYRTHGPKAMLDPNELEEIESHPKTPGVGRTVIFPVALLGLSSYLLYFFSDICVDNAIVIAKGLGVSERLIGLSVLAVGTSLPEIVTVVVAAIRGLNAISLGTILGSNLINIGIVLGTAIMAKPFWLLSTDFQYDVIISALMTLIIIPLVVWGNKLPRLIGAVLFLAYGIYIYTVF